MFITPLKKDGIKLTVSLPTYEMLNHIASFDKNLRNTHNKYNTIL